MSKTTIIQAWKNQEFRKSLSEAELANLPANPAGATMLSGSELDQVSGGLPPSTAKCTDMGQCTVVCTYQDWCFSNVCSVLCTQYVFCD
jgi:mersacidin/lichenicidin family type 2 lantibiotic